MNKAEIALELTKLITDKALKQEKHTDFANFDYAKNLANTYNEIYNTINITETTN